MVREAAMEQGVSEKASEGEHPLVGTEAHVESFRQTRQARRLELVEDYVELIADLIDDGGGSASDRYRAPPGRRAGPDGAARSS